ncbi:MAG: nitroreductase family protein [Clostridiales bacterium]|nr:nitroreductase family protein [Clostridiales bacterium]
MTVREGIHQRRSIRRYADRPVEEEQIDLLLEAAMAAPSACDCRPWEFIVVRDPARLAALAGISPYSQMAAHCSVAIVPCAVPERQAICPGFFPQDCGAMIQNIWLQATELGLGMVWCGIHPIKELEERMAGLLETPEGVVPFALLCIGYPAEQPAPRNRFEQDRIHREQW